MLRHQLVVAERERPRARLRLTWPDRAWLALLAGTLPAERLAAMRLIVTPGTVLRWHRYLGWPGQVPSYKLGERVWLQAREEARARAGGAFSLKDFHSKALSLGAMGLDPLREALSRC